MEEPPLNSTQDNRFEWAAWDVPLDDLLLDSSSVSDGCFVTAITHPRFGDGWLVLRSPVEKLIASRLDEVRPILDRIEEWTTLGHFAAGYVAYEAAPAFDVAFLVHDPATEPLAVFHLYDTAPTFYKELKLAKHSGETSPTWTADWDESTYHERFDHVKTLIGNGTSYQVNLTYRLSSESSEALPHLFARLVADDPPAYASLFLSDRINIASLSPELFFEQSNGWIKCKPMKGTAPLGCSWPETRANTEDLKASEKNRAENLMVVDMIRNDLGRVAEVGTVTTPSIFDVEQLSTVLQMTSTIQAKFDGSVRQIFDALFPCASIVGAPKVSTMQIIRALEDTPRGVYTGAIGIVGPSRTSRFSVAIRTISQVGKNPMQYGVGSGVVWDSTAEGEWAENHLKTDVLSRVSAQFGLFETIHWPLTDGGELLALHLNRISKAAAAFGIPFDALVVEALLYQQLQHLNEPTRARLKLLDDGQISVSHQPLGEVPKALQFSISASPVCSEDPLLKFKTTRRKIYDKSLRNSCCDEVLLWNERQEITEFCKGNIVIRVGGDLVTPSIEAGLLGGVYREQLLRKGQIREGGILLSDINEESEVYRINALTGMIRAHLNT